MTKNSMESHGIFYSLKRSIHKGAANFKGQSWGEKKNLVTVQVETVSRWAFLLASGGSSRAAGGVAGWALLSVRHGSLPPVTPSRGNTFM